MAGENYTPQEKRNLELVREYMEIAYSPQRASAEAVAHLCAAGNKFIVPSTFPEVHTLEEYAEDHAQIMRQVNDLHLVSFDVFFAKGGTGCVSGTRLRVPTQVNRMGTFSRAGTGPGGPPRRCSGWKMASWRSSSRIGTSSRCGNSWAGRWRNA